jgi:hypothetical protein
MVISTFKLPSSDCPRCGESGRFVGMERHDTLRNTNLLTFECEQCGYYAIDRPVMKTPGKIYRSSKFG